ncbi:MAG: hypothetical protein HKL99_13150 [Burkholderiales bacterium]|nr:hypothetical protein [Burkholderiales bacterium]
MHWTLIVVFLLVMAVILALVGRDARQTIWREIWATSLHDWHAFLRLFGRGRN